MLKKTKLYIGIALMVQAVSCFIAFLSLLKKEKSFAKAFLIAAAAGGLAGCTVLYLHARDRLKYKKSLLRQNGHDFSDDFDELYDLDEISQYDDIDDIAAEDGVDTLSF